MNKRAVGYEKEELSARFLMEKGYQVIERNFYSRFGEIDLICKKEGYLIFVEVKYRSNQEFGFPSEAVTAKKRLAMFKTARYYLYKNGLTEDIPCRFDTVSILDQEFEIIENCLEG